MKIHVPILSPTHICGFEVRLNESLDQFDPSNYFKYIVVSSPEDILRLQEHGTLYDVRIPVLDSSKRNGRSKIC